MFQALREAIEAAEATPHCHTVVHQPGWSERLEPDGTYTVITPSGEELTSHPPGARSPTRCWPGRWARPSLHPSGYPLEAVAPKPCRPRDRSMDRVAILKWLPTRSAVTVQGLIGFDVETGSWIVRPELPQTP